VFEVAFPKEMNWVFQVEPAEVEFGEEPLKEAALRVLLELERPPVSEAFTEDAPLN